MYSSENVKRHLREDKGHSFTFPGCIKVRRRACFFQTFCVPEVVLVPYFISIFFNFSRQKLKKMLIKYGTNTTSSGTQKVGKKHALLLTFIQPGNIKLWPLSSRKCLSTLSLLYMAHQWAMDSFNTTQMPNAKIFLKAHWPHSDQHFFVASTLRPQILDCLRGVAFLDWDLQLTMAPNSSKSLT